MSENPTYAYNLIAERKALGLLKSIVEESGGSLRLEGQRLIVARKDEARYFVDLRSAKVYNEHGKFICLRVFGHGLPIVDQVIAKSLYLLTSPRQQIGTDHDLLFKVTFIGSGPSVEWPWISSMSLSTLEETFSKLIGVDFAIKRVNIGNLAVKLQIWYLNYATQFRFMGAKYLQGSMGGVILSARNGNPEKLGDLQRIIDELRFYNGRKLPIILIGLYDEVSGHNESSADLKDEEELAKRNNIPFFRCSLTHPATTDKPFAYLTNMILGRFTRQPAT
nr:hypothetical protein [Candidatus Njordarchaeota archaeon]